MWDIPGWTVLPCFLNNVRLTASCFKKASMVSSGYSVGWDGCLGDERNYLDARKLSIQVVFFFKASIPWHLILKPTRNEKNFTGRKGCGINEKNRIHESGKILQGSGSFAISAVSFPRKRGTQWSICAIQKELFRKVWMPACAGMTGKTPRCLRYSAACWKRFYLGLKISFQLRPYLDFWMWRNIWFPVSSKKTETLPVGSFANIFLKSASVRWMRNQSLQYSIMYRDWFDTWKFPATSSPPGFRRR